METLQLIDPYEEKHFCDMSLLHALGWRTAYRDSIPAGYLDREITDDRWVPVFRQNYKEGVYHGLLLYDGDRPLCWPPTAPPGWISPPGTPSAISAPPTWPPGGSWSPSTPIRTAGDRRTALL